MATTNSARKILKSLLSNTPSCDSASSVEVRTATSESNSVSDASDVRGVIAMDGLLKYEDLIALLSCSLCQKFCGKSIVQCRKGHVICKNCKTVSKLTSCPTCKQVFLDVPNVVLDKLISMIALPCRFRSSGCGQFVFPDKKIEHETFCSCRPINCQYAVDGCSAELPYKDLAAHHRQCQHNPRNQK